jgi:hypothetical protein
LLASVHKVKLSELLLGLIHRFFLKSLEDVAVCEAETMIVFCFIWQQGCLESRLLAELGSLGLLRFKGYQAGTVTALGCVVDCFRGAHRRRVLQCQGYRGH